MRKVEVVPFNESWPVMFEEKARKIHNVFGNEIKAFQ
jgi:GrpB-like predicted nucleotidyltransferase (UPF0157 family)